MMLCLIKTRPRSPWGLLVLTRSVFMLEEVTKPVHTHTHRHRHTKLPKHLRPEAEIWKPSGHKQVKLPSLFEQVPNKHISGDWEHSSISETQKEEQHQSPHQRDTFYIYILNPFLILWLQSSTLQSFIHISFFLVLSWLHGWSHTSTLCSIPMW